MLLILPGLIWGASFLFIAEGLRATGPMGVSLLRIVIGFAAVACFRDAWKPIDRADWGKIAWLGILWLAFPLSMFPFAEQRISSALAGMLNGAVPLTATAIASIIARRLPSRGITTGLAVGLAGAILMGLPNLGERSSAAGVLMVVAAVISYGFAPNIARPLQQKYGALPVIWRAQGFALVLLLPFGVKDVATAQWSLVPILCLLALGALGTGVAHVAMTTASGRFGAAKASATAFLIPPVALVLGLVVRHEQVAALAVAGGALCLAGAWFMRRATMAAQPAATPAPQVARAAAVLFLVLVPVRAVAQSPSTQHPTPITRLSGPITLDGRGDDPAWQQVAPLPMTVFLPTYGSTPSERTDARIAYDDDAIYVMIDCWEAHPGSIRASSMIRDDDAPGDFLNVLLDTFGDRQNAVNFSTTPGGQRNDWSVSNDARDAASLSPAWNGVWDLVVRRGNDGWHAEYRIPFTTLRFQPVDGRVEFGLSINRLTAHSNERVTFPAIEPTSGLALWKPSRWQRVSIEGIHVARSLRVMPWMVAGLEGLRAPDPALSPWDRNDKVDAGVDLKTALTPNLTLDLTANTDFAEAEADDQRVNLTRFPLFYPERRGFFVERAGTFDLRTGESDILFNSRRVGLTAAGAPVRLLGGARLVGRAGAWDVGLFNAQTEDHENLGVLRVKHGVLNDRSWLGFMTTTRLVADSSQAAFALDGDIHIAGDDYFSGAVVAVSGEQSAGSGGFLPDGAVRLLLERRRNRGFWYRATVATTGARYAPALAYVERGDAIRPAGEVGYGRTVSSRGAQLRGTLATSLAYHNAAGTFESALHTASLAYERPSGGIWTLFGARQEDDLLLPFAPTPATTVPAGSYRAHYAQLVYTPPTGPRAVVGLTARAGEYFDGTLVTLTLAPEWRASAHLRMSAEVEVDRVEFSGRGEREWSKLARLRIFAATSPRLSLSALLQANALAHVATGNIRLRYNVREGHDLWVVYGQNENLDRDRFTPGVIPATARAQLLVKYTRSFGR